MGKLKNRKNHFFARALFITLVLLAFFSTSTVHAADFEVTGWIPYWSVRQGTKSARANLDVLTEINPFAFTVKNDGSLEDLAGLRKSQWKSLFSRARRGDVEIIPTVMWSNTNVIHTVLSNPDSRKDHIEEIAAMVKRGKYDGVDIDYEGKRAETKDYFSTFLRELKKELGSKTLSCSIESRIPPDSMYTVIPTNLAYANDLVLIGQYCDKVKVMAYDQQRIDIQINAAKKGLPYIPVSDADWARKVVNFMALSIPKNKMLLGVPTYGREWEVAVTPDQFKNYNQIRAINQEPALDLADDLDLKPVRNQAGELSYTYIPEKLTDPISTLIRGNFNLPIPAGTDPANVTAARALALSNNSGLPIRFNIVWWSDAEAIRQKVALAKELGLAGVAIFKIDGEEDKRIWDLF